MNFDPNFNDNDSPEPNVEPTLLDFSVAEFAETSIVGMIVLGSGGPENAEITDQGLRFIRHIMANSRSCKSGFLPNFKDMDCIQEQARDFIRRCGTATSALQTMYQVI